MAEQIVMIGGGPGLGKTSRCAGHGKHGRGAWDAVHIAAQQLKKKM